MDFIIKKAPTDCKSCLENMSAEDNQLIFKCLKCNKSYNKEFNEDLTKILIFASTYEFCDKDINKLILLLRKGVYHYEYMNTWGIFDEVSLPNKEDFYNNLNIEDIKDVNYMHAKKVFTAVNNKNIGDYHHLYVQSDTLLLADVFKNFIKKCIKIYELDPAHFLYAPGLAWQAYLKRQK